MKLQPGEESNREGHFQSEELGLLGILGSGVPDNATGELSILPCLAPSLRNGVQKIDLDIILRMHDEYHGTPCLMIPGL